MEGGRGYPAPLGEAALAFFVQWLGRHYARSISVEEREKPSEELAAAQLIIGRRWRLRVAVINLVASEATYRSELSRAALERRLDAAGLSVIVWAPRGAPLPFDEPALSELAIAVEEAKPTGDGRLEARLPVTLYLRRTAPTGSVVTAFGAFADHWAQFTNRVPGSFQLDSRALHRLPADPQEREALVERIVMAAQQPEVDEGVEIPAFDAWTVTRLDGERAYVVASPQEPSDDLSASQRRALRRLLGEAREAVSGPADARALAVLTVSTYAEGERVSWALRGIDPALYAEFDLLTVLADGLAKPVLEPPRGALPWDAPLGPAGRA
ncbi:hypothetical protein HRbin29_00501 [bacterium HR29]|nr:hypothetical protein HRbin29_00501 [bacterium HR29]